MRTKIFVDARVLYVIYIVAIFFIQNDLLIFGFGVLHGVEGMFADDVSGAAVGPIFNGHRA